MLPLRMDPVYICDMARFVSESDSKKVNHIYKHVGSISMVVKKKRSHYQEVL